MTERQDTRWFCIWLVCLGLAWLWNHTFLNLPAFEQIQTAFVHSSLIAVTTVVISLGLAWSVAIGLYFLERSALAPLAFLVSFLLNLIRSVPQIVGILGGYVVLTVLLRKGMLPAEWMVLTGMAVVTGVFVFLELADLIRERIDHYTASDFVNAMLVCGIPEGRIVTVEILWKNSLAHILNKLIALLGMTIFLQCSVDFILSVGLSTDVSPVNLPITLGSMLARIDSKQDILAIGHTLTHPFYAPNLIFQHLQGLTTAFLIVFTLVAVYRISDGFARRHGL